MFHMTTSVFLFLLLGGLSAQQPTSYFIPDNNATTGQSNTLPFGNVSTNHARDSYQFYHTLVLDTDVKKRIDSGPCKSLSPGRADYRSRFDGCQRTA